MNNHPEGRAIMFEGQTYSKRKILDFINILSGFEVVLKTVALFKGIYTKYTVSYLRLMLRNRKIFVF